MHSFNYPEELVAKLLVTAHAGSMDALGQLLEMYRPELEDLAEHCIARDLRRKADGSDLVEEVFVKALGKFTAFSGTSAAVFQAWLRAILLHHLTDFRREYREGKKRAVSRETPIDCLSPRDREALSHPVNPAPDDALDEGDKEHVLHLCLAVLSEAGRNVVRLHWLEGISFEEIGLRLGISTTAARKRCARALEMMAKLPFARELFEV